MINIQDPKSGSSIAEVPSDYYRNNGYYRYLEYQLTQGQFQYLFKENVVFTGGTSKVPFCYNRITEIPFESTFKVGASITSAQTILRDRIINYGTNTGQFATSAGAEIAYFIFKPNTSYSMQLIPSVSMRMTIDLRIVEKH